MTNDAEGNNAIAASMVMKLAVATSPSTKRVPKRVAVVVAAVAVVAAVVAVHAGS